MKCIKAEYKVFEDRSIASLIILNYKSCSKFCFSYHKNDFILRMKQTESSLPFFKKNSFSRVS